MMALDAGGPVTWGTGKGFTVTFRDKHTEANQQEEEQTRQALYSDVTLTEKHTFVMVRPTSLLPRVR